MFLRGLERIRDSMWIFLKAWFELPLGGPRRQTKLERTGLNVTERSVCYVAEK